jgi:hypothetical protein
MFFFDDKFRLSASITRHNLSALAIACAMCGFWGAGAASAQNAPKPVVSTAVVKQSMEPVAPLWSSLTALQRESLQPLASTWETLSVTHKRKWMALVQNFDSMAATEQSKLHARMAEWAALKPREREVARLNFADTKMVSPENRSASWEAYQALSPEDRKKLAKKSKSKPLGAALAVKPVDPDKLASIPSIKSAPHSARAAIQLPTDRKTLLPQSVTRPARATSSPLAGP